MNVILGIVTFLLLEVALYLTIGSLLLSISPMHAYVIGGLLILRLVTGFFVKKDLKLEQKK